VRFENQEPIIIIIHSPGEAADDLFNPADLTLYQTTATAEIKLELFRGLPQ
jgi:hypothetical protein